MLMVVGAQEQPCTFQVGWGGEGVHLIELRPDSDTAVLARECAKLLPADAVGNGCDAAAGGHGRRAAIGATGGDW